MHMYIYIYRFIYGAHVIVPVQNRADAYIYVCIYLYVHMKSSFPKRVNPRSKNLCCNTNVKFRDPVLEKSS